MRETLESVASQTWKNWEIVVVEDGSQDSTEAIVQQFAQTVSQPVFYKRQNQNAGLSKTRNVANTLISGQWLAFLDSDDLWLPDHLASCMRAVDEQNPSRASVEPLLVFSGCLLFDSESRATIQHRTPTAAQWADFPYRYIGAR